MEPDDVLTAVASEFHKAQRKHRPMHSSHEGYAVILEELDELWSEIKFGSVGKQRDEAIQVAAMAVRFLVDICGLNAPDEPYSLSAALREKEREVERIREVSAAALKSWDTWQASVENVIQRPLDYSGWPEIEALRAALQPATGEPDAE